MKPLPLELTMNGFILKQVERTETAAVYSKRKPEWAESAAHFEVIRIRKRKQEEYPKGNIIPAHESFPSTESWGALGFSYLTLTEARNRLALLTCQAKQAS